MKLLPIVIVATVVGAVLGTAAAYVQVGPGQPVPSFVPPANAEAPGPEATSQDGPRAVVDEPVFNFGNMLRGATQSHEFVVRNEGTEPLTLKVGTTTCKCTLGEVSEAPIPPGESTPVRLEWVAKAGLGGFRQIATILTNDPRQPKLELSVDGMVTDVASLEPSAFRLGTFNSAEPQTATLYVLSFNDADLEVTAEMDERTDQPERFELKITPIEPSELPGAERATTVLAAARVDLTAPSGLPIGTLREWVNIKTNLEGQETLAVPAGGNVEGDISVHGRGWSDETGVLNLGIVPGANGVKTKLLLSCKGPQAETIAFEIAEVDPPELKVELGERKIRGPGKSHTPLKISIPPGTRPMVHLNTDQGDDASVLLKSNHPTSPELKLSVRFAVEG